MDASDAWICLIGAVGSTGHPSSHLLVLAATLVLVPLALIGGRHLLAQARPASGDPLPATAPRRGLRAQVEAWLPRGDALPPEVWAARHRAILWVLWAHIPGIVLFGLFGSQPVVLVLVETAVVALFAGAAAVLRRRHRLSTILTSLGLLTCSALLVYMSGGVIEMHFHYFVIVAVVTLYQDRWPFLIAIGYVVVQHGLFGAIDPASVYNHPGAVSNPWGWAVVHGAFVLGMSAAGIASWRLNEAFLASTRAVEVQLSEAQQVARLGSWEARRELEGVVWSEEMFRLLDLDPRTTSPHREVFLARVHPSDRNQVRDGLDRTEAEGRPFARDTRFVLADGTLRWLHVRARVTEWIEDRATVLSGTVQDVTERKEAETDMRTALSLLGATLDATADGILVVDGAGAITRYNQRFLEMWRVPGALMAEANDASVLAFVMPQLTDAGAFAAKVHELYATPEAESLDDVEFLDGRLFERFSKPQRIDGRTVGRVWSFRDVTQRKRLEQDLVHQAFHDSLTGFANQALFRDRVEHAIARADRTHDDLAVLFLDLDDFKTVNDSLGHTFGDELLVAVARRLEACLRDTDTAARLGGDEFAILVEDVGGSRDVTAVAERIGAALGVPCTIDGHEVVVGVSIGVAFHTRGTTVDQLLRNSDLAMYTAKRRGKGTCVVYEAAMHAAAVDRLQLEGDLRRAITGNELVVQYQPIVAMDAGQVKGFEALVRWQHPERGMVPPLSFIPLAEETGLVKELGRQVLERACADMASWLRAPGGTTAQTVTVNVSPRQLQSDELLDHVRFALAAADLAPHHLVLEITETAMMHDTEATIERLRMLKALGVRLAIDDFGTGYSSLSYLQRFPVDIVKIDRSFISAITAGADESPLARAIVSLANSLQLEAIAEGVETAVQADALRELGCGFAQGFHFARPMDADAVTALLGGRPDLEAADQVLPVPQLA